MTGSRVVPQVYPQKYNINGKNHLRNTHFRVSFNTYRNGGRFYGLRNLLLRFHNGDPLYARQILAWDLLNRFGVRAQRASYARVFLRIGKGRKDVAFGVYAMVEPVDRSFLKSRFHDDGGHLWKCLTTRQGGVAALTNAVPMTSAVIGRERHSLDPVTNYSPTYDFKTQSKKRGVLFKDARKAFEDFVRNLNTLEGAVFEKWISRVMDVDQLLRLYAMHVLIGSFDDYWNNGKNYYLYRDSHQRWFFIPDDYDYTFGSGFKFGGGKDFSTLNVFSWGRPGRPLLNKIMSRPRFRKQYAAFMVRALDPAGGLFTIDSIRRRILRWHGMIGKYVDPSRVDTESSVVNNRHRIEDSPFMGYGASPVKFLLFSGSYSNNYLIRRITSARKQLGLE